MKTHTHNIDFSKLDTAIDKLLTKKSNAECAFSYIVDIEAIKKAILSIHTANAIIDSDKTEKSLESISIMTNNETKNCEIVSHHKNHAIVPYISHHDTIQFKTSTIIDNRNIIRYNNINVSFSNKKNTFTSLRDILLAAKSGHYSFKNLHDINGDFAIINHVKSDKLSMIQCGITNLSIGNNLLGRLWNTIHLSPYCKSINLDQNYIIARTINNKSLVLEDGSNVECHGAMLCSNCIDILSDVDKKDLKYPSWVIAKIFSKQ